MADGCNVNSIFFKFFLEVVSVQTASVVLQSVEGTQTQLQMDAGKSLQPVLLNSSLCANVVLKVRSTGRCNQVLFLDQCSFSFITVNLDDEYR